MNKGSVVRIVVADDHAMVREGIRHVLDGSPDFEVVSEAANGDEALTAVQEFEPDVAVLDITMPEKTGIEVTKILQRDFPTVRILILSMHDHTQYALEAIRAGATGFLLKDAEPAELRKAVKSVSRGEAYYSPSIARHLTNALSGAQQGEAHAQTVDDLTARERDVLLGIANGKTNKEIAADLGIGTRTVETHRESLMRKLEIRTVAGLTRFAIEAGLLSS
ncbi:MAG: response regulator transcription factor [Gemmatimonadota bacterium]|nr:response regulator transcription factor [Gemmatimonadota bacterium]MDH5803763.1 response regulator transcription factor [Gemmatimonadota bacterium]